MNSKRTALAAHLALLAIVAIWGSTFAVVKASLRDCTPLLFNQIRMILAATILVAVNARELRRMKLRMLAAGALVGFLLALGYELQTAGLARTSAANSAFLTGLVVVIVPLLGAIPGCSASGTGKVRWPSVCGAVLAFGGIVLLTTPPGTPLANFAGALSAGDLLSLLCAFAFALHLLAISRATHTMSAGQLAALQLVFCAAAMSVATPLLERPHLYLTRQLVLAWLVTAVFGTALAFTVQSWVQQHLPASHTALLLALEPAFAWVTSLVFFGEKLTPRSTAGACAIFAGLIVSEASSRMPVSEQPEANTR